jgi:hypothetical protein
MYEAITARENAEWIRSLTSQERFAIYADLFDVIWSARQTLGDWEQLECWQWDQKLAHRLRMVEAFSKLDEFRRERAAANNAC